MKSNKNSTAYVASQKKVVALIPIVLADMFAAALKKNGETCRRVLMQFCKDYVRNTFTDADFAAMEAYIDKYYPPLKNEETRAYWDAKIDEARVIREDAERQARNARRRKRKKQD